ncbi:MAG TPA: hypothetical protein VHV82_17355 [Sporichthyaceae bacterium]|jgi:hypothetical protein|nr:hypothetical protein [Sporichthyaceae bacterium]
MSISRRSLLGGLGAAALLGGCGGGRPAAAPSSTTAPGAGPSPVPTPTPALPQTTPWTARPGEVNPAVKARATGLLQLVGTWSADGVGLAAAEQRVQAAGYDLGLIEQLEFLAPNAEAAVTNFVDAQYGGILSDSASVLIMAAQWYRTAGGPIVRHGSTFDVRLAGADPHWTVTAVHPAAPGPPSTGLTTLAESVLANGRIHLPDSARADVTAGQIHDSVLGALDKLARNHVLDVSVLRSGHPLLVFGTDRPSDHPHGRAADIWAIDGSVVVDPANRDLVIAFMREAAAAGPWQVGGPVDLDGPNGHQYFSDNTHHDHVHMGFRT